MKLFVFQLIVVVGVVGDALAKDPYFFSVSIKDCIEAERKLEAYEKGKLSLQDLNEKAGEEGCKQLIGYYLLHTNDISPKAKLPISRCYAAFAMYPDVVKLASEYVSVYSNDWHGWRILGTAYDLMNSSTKSINAYSNAVRLGDTKSYESLAGVALKNHQPEIVRDLVPKLIALKDGKQTPRDNKLNVISILLFYSIDADRKDVFIRTLEGEDMKDMLSNDMIKKNIMTGCKRFEGLEIDVIRHELEAAIQRESKSVGE